MPDANTVLFIGGIVCSNIGTVWVMKFLCWLSRKALEDELEEVSWKLSMAENQIESLEEALERAYDAI